MLKQSTIVSHNEGPWRGYGLQLAAHFWFENYFWCVFECSVRAAVWTTGNYFNVKGYLSWPLSVCLSKDTVWPHSCECLFVFQLENEWCIFVFSKEKAPSCLPMLSNDSALHLVNMLISVGQNWNGIRLSPHFVSLCYEAIIFHVAWKQSDQH